MPLPKEWIITKFHKGYDFDMTSRDDLLTRRQMIGKLKELEATFPNNTFQGKNLKTFEVYERSVKKEYIIQKYNTELRLWENMSSTDYLLTRSQMRKELRKFEANFPNDEFRGHNWAGCIRHEADQYKP